MATKKPVMYKGYIIRTENNKLSAFSFRTNIHLNQIFNTWPQLKTVIDGLKEI